VILRVWYARAAEVAGYRRHFEERVVPELQGLAGFQGATVAQRRLADSVELKVETRWASLEAVRAFAGPDIDAAVVEPEARDVLIDYDERVAHYEVIAEAPGAPRPD
jgi:heme-degrading monooxygenase HmoA